MQSLNGDRFLKRFFGNRLHLREVNQDCEEMTLPANGTGQPEVPGDTTRENLPDTDAKLENEQTGEIHQPAVPENGSAQPTTDDHPFTVDIKRD